MKQPGALFTALAPDFDLLDINLNNFDGTLQAKSLSEIRKKMVGILKGLFVMVQEYSNWFKKIFYIVSLFLIGTEAFRFGSSRHSSV